MTREVRLPGDSKSYAKLAFREKAKFHERQSKLSFKAKLEIADRLRESMQDFPRIGMMRESTESQVSSGSPHVALHSAPPDEPL